MWRFDTISLLDGDEHRCAAHLQALDGIRFSCQGYRSLEEFRQSGITESLIIFPDEGTWLLDLLHDMATRDYWAPALAFGGELDPVRCSLTVLSGDVVGFLNSDLNRHDLERYLDNRAKELSLVVEERRAVAEARRRLKSLSRRESEVLHQLQAGLTNRQIGDILGLSPRTVEVHRANIMRKTKSSSLVALVELNAKASSNMINGAPDLHFLER